MAEVEDRLSRLESRVENLSSSLTQLEDRLLSLETGAGTASDGAPPRARPPGPEPASVPTDSAIARGMALSGRTLLVLGGAYLLRAVTESGAVAPLAGVALGLAYAVSWLVLADRAGARSLTSSAAFHGAAAVLVAFPLLWEATARFGILSPPWSAASLALVSGVAVVVAWRRRLRSFAWVTVVGATLTSLLLLGGTRDLVSFTLVLVFLGVASLLLSYHSAWPAVHWAVSAAADLAVLLAGVGAVIGRDTQASTGTVVVQLALFCGFLLPMLHRMWKHRLEPGAFELTQTALVTLIGYGGALWTVQGGAGFVLGGIGLALSLSSYAVAVTFTKQRPRTASYFELLGLLLALLGGLAFTIAPTLVFVLFAGGLFWLGSRQARPLVQLNGSAFVLAAAISSGLIVQAAFAFAAPASYAWPSVGPWLLVSLGAAALCLFLPAASTREALWLERWRLGRLLALVIAVVGSGGTALSIVVPWTAGIPGHGADAAILGTVRTAVLALSALALAYVGRFHRLREASSLVYPLLVAAGIKLVVEDFPQGRAATLFVGLVLYGGALLTAPRLARATTSS